MSTRGSWTIDVYETELGEKPVWSFIRGLTGRDKAEAVALVKLLESQGNQLRRPQSAALGEGLFELRGKQVRIFYVFRPDRVITLLDGEIKKRSAVSAKTLERMRSYQKRLTRPGTARVRRRR